MNSANEFGVPLAKDVRVTQETLTVDLNDGRCLSVPLAWFPRLMTGSRRERSHWRLIGEGDGVHWTDLDEDISVEGLLAGRMSGESSRSLQQWLDARPARRVRRGRSA